MMGKHRVYQTHKGKYTFKIPVLGIPKQLVVFFIEHFLVCMLYNTIVFIKMKI